MIEQPFITYLKTDVALIALLGSATRIYPEIAPQGATLPYLIYRNSSGSDNELIDGDRLQINVWAGTKLASQNIRDRIKLLLDMEDNEAQSLIVSTTNYICHSRFSTGDSAFDYDTKAYIEVLFFDVMYKNKTP